MTLIMASRSALAYDMGIKGGATVTQHRIADSMGQRFGEQSMGIGYLFGLFWQSSEPGLGYEVDLFYSRRSSVPSTIGTQEIVYVLNNLEIPVLLRYEFESVYFGLGGYFKHGLGPVRIKGGDVIQDKDYNYASLRLYTWELGAAGTIGAKFDTGLGFINLETRFNLGLSNRAKAPSGQTTFDSWSYDLLLGVSF